MESKPVPFRLVIFDLDGVLVPIESSWQYVHNAFGCDNDENFRRYIRGMTDFQEFMRSDISLWSGASIQDIQTILDRIPLTEGAYETVRTLHEKGIRTAIVSSGISLLASRVGRELGIDLVYANDLLADEHGHLTGEGVGIVPLLEKHNVTKRILKEEKLSARECATIGDNVFDIPHFGDIGLSVAFNPRSEELETKADISITGKDIRLILPWLTSGPPNKIILRLATGEREAKTTISALSPDNFKVPQGLYIKAYLKGRNVFVKIVSVRGLRTLLATVDEILSCSQIAISSIDVVKSLE